MSQNNSQLEVEVKFFAPALADLRAQIVVAGATLKKPRVFEKNVRYDDADDSLLAVGSLLRLRQDSSIRLTWKGIPQDAAAMLSEAKVREELEIEVSDFDTAALIVQRLGFRPKQTYEKYRETFQLDDVEIVLDELPYGDFVELEGSEASIRAVAEQLNLDWKDRITTNYLGMLAQLNAHFGRTINDLTFDNFSDSTLSIADVLK